MQLTDEAQKLLETFIEEKVTPELEKKKMEKVSDLFLQISPCLDRQEPNFKLRLMDLWLDTHIEKYFMPLEKEFDESDFDDEVKVYIPVHGTVNLRPEIQYLLTLPIIRRCSSIKQLSTTFTIFPGAKHTRYEHLLGTLRVMQKFCDHFIKKGVVPKEYDVTLEVAALIHDLAHPPMGHSLDPLKRNLIPKAEDGTQCFLPDKKIDKSLLEIYLTDDRYQLKKALESINKVDMGLLKSMLVENSDNFPLDYADLIDSKIDADRIDYLLRDTVHTGYSKKETFDCDSIIENSYFCKLEGVSPRKVLSYAESIETELTSFLRMRNIMYLEVYENTDKLILDEVIMHVVYATLQYYKQENNEITRKLLLLNDYEFSEFLRYFSPNSYYDFFDSQLNGKPKYSLIKSYSLFDENNKDLAHSLREATSMYFKVVGFKRKLSDEDELSTRMSLVTDVSRNGIPPIIFSSPHYTPHSSEWRSGCADGDRDHRKNSADDLVLRRKDGKCGYFKDLSQIQRENNPNLNKFLLIGDHDILERNSLKKDQIANEFEQFILLRYPRNIEL